MWFPGRLAGFHLHQVAKVVGRAMQPLGEVGNRRSAVALGCGGVTELVVQQGLETRQHPGGQSLLVLDGAGRLPAAQNPSASFVRGNRYSVRRASSAGTVRLTTTGSCSWPSPRTARTGGQLGYAGDRGGTPRGDSRTADRHRRHRAVSERNRHLTTLASLAAIFELDRPVYHLRKCVGRGNHRQ